MFAETHDYLCVCFGQGVLMPFTVLDPSTAALAPSTTIGQPYEAIGETLFSMQLDITDNLQSRTDIATRTQGWINKAYRNVAAMLEMNELYASIQLEVVAGQPFYLIPDVVSWITWIGNEDSNDYFDGGRGFEMIDVQGYRMLPDSSAFGSSTLLPVQYFRYGRMVVLYPTPSIDLTVTMDFRVRPVDLTQPDDSPIIPVEFHEVVMLMGLARACRSVGLRGDGDKWFNDAITTLRPILNTDASERDSMHMSMQPIRQKSQLYRRSR